MAETVDRPQTDTDQGAPHRTAESQSAESAERALVRQRLQGRRDFASHAFVFLVLNTAVVLIWAITGSGYFWPAWLIGLWAAGLIMHGWDAFIRRPVTEEEVDEAMGKRLSPVAERAPRVVSDDLRPRDE